jgi:hypothetical protein
MADRLSSDYLQQFRPTFRAGGSSLGRSRWSRLKLLKQVKGPGGGGARPTSTVVRTISE